MKKRKHSIPTFLTHALTIVIAFSAQSTFAQITIDSANRFVFASVPPPAATESTSALGTFNKSIGGFSGDRLSTASQSSDIQLNGNLLTVTGTGNDTGGGSVNAKSDLLLDFTLSSPTALQGDASAKKDELFGDFNPVIYVSLVNLSTSSTVFEVGERHFGSDPKSATLNQVLPAGSYRLEAKTETGSADTDGTWTLDLRIGSAVPDGGSTGFLLASATVVALLRKRNQLRADTMSQN